MTRDRLAILLLTLCWLATPLQACQICLPFPTKSLADYLIEADQIVLARENPEKPFSLIATETIKGDAAHPAIDLFLDSQSRRILAGNAAKHIVCTRIETGGSNEWRRVATCDPFLRSMILEMLAKVPDWTQDPGKRPTYFAPYLGHDDPQLSTLAHLEVARAPYSEIRDLAGSIPADEILAFLADFRMTEWHALYILLLAQSEDLEDLKRIKNTVESNARFSIVIHTAAWATAYIETAEEKALDFFDQRYLANSDRTPEELRAILAAYSVHGTNGHIHLRDRMVDSYRDLADQHPELLPTLTADLTKWRNWEFTDKVNDILTSQPENFDLESILQLRSYLRDAAHDRNPPAESKSSPNAAIWLIGALLLLPLAIKLLGSRKADPGSAP